jgi:hypothetical protein
VVGTGLSLNVAVAGSLVLYKLALLSDRRGVWQAGPVPGGLLDDTALATSGVVANVAMNRRRQLTGVNSYAKELGFNPLDVITECVERSVVGGAVVGWLDLCCGTGHALIQAVDQLHRSGLAKKDGDRRGGPGRLLRPGPHSRCRRWIWCARRCPGRHPPAGSI